MRASNIAFCDLRAEMSRKNIGIAEMANELGWNRGTLARKLSKRSPLNLNEAFDIQQRFFPGLDIVYLFQEAKCSNSGQSDEAS